MPPPKNVKAPQVGPWAWATSTDPASIGLPELIKVYRLDSKECPFGCRRPCRKNPFCLWGLGDRHWRKEEDTEDERERNPNRDEGQIIGIQNLGATCYVNSLLQLWYHNPIIRPAILKWKPPAPARPYSDTDIYTPLCAVSQLQAMFARLKISKQSAIDPRPFVTALELDDQVQQDAQEFSKLLMACITKILEQSPENAEICTTFKDCFTGQSLFETVCDNCKTRRSAQTEDFNELQLPVHKRLRDSFEEYLKPSRLEGDNKYFCMVCNTKQDATRAMNILKLPPVLNLQLMRFIYDWETHDRKKVQKSIEFPEILDMTEFVSPEHRGGDEKLVYQLNAVLIHKGRKVSSGHYIAHIKDSASGGWFECNDDSIQKIDRKGYSQNLVMHDEEEDGKDKNTGTDSSEKVDKSSNANLPSDKKKKEPLASGDSKEKKPTNPSSTGAYMLVYTMVKCFKDLQPDPEISPELTRLIKQEDLKFEEEFTRTKEEKDREAKKKADRQAEVDMLFKSRIPVDLDTEDGENKPKQNGGSRQDETKKTIATKGASSKVENMEIDVEEGDAGPNYDFIAVEWLEKWLDPKVADPPKITNEKLTCSHGKLSPPKRCDLTVAYKAIPTNFAEHIYEKYKGNRLFGKTALCLDCVRAHCQMIQALLKLDEDHQNVQAETKKSDELLEQFRKKGTPPSEIFLSDKVIIGKETARTWKKYARDEIERPDSEDCQEILVQWNFNQDVECSHGRLDPNSRSSRKFISMTAWSIISLYFKNVVMYSCKAEECPECVSINRANTVVKDQNKILAMKQKQKLAHLLVGKNRPSEFIPGEYYLVPTEFVEEWRKFIRDPDVNDSILSIKTDDLVCDCNGCGCPEPCLKYPIDVVQRARAIDSENANVVTLIREDELSVFRDCATTMDREIKFTMEYQDTLLSYSYNIGVCRPSANKWLSNLTDRAFEYEDGNIYIKKIDEGDEELVDDCRNDDEEHIPPNKKERKDNDIPSVNCNVRRSNRARHSRNEFKYKSIYSTMRIIDFQKNYIIKDYKAMMSDQHLYFNKKELTEEQKRMTFGELKIQSGATLLLRVDEPNSKDMDTDKPTKPELGFSGTLLASTHTVSPSTSHTNGLSV